ncbi:PREDICTED: phosphatidylinositol glycan anchor biosynthesis class U protein-like [Acropora digitifera]|uniref:phosphatidylinositol glycan anchor biosynthesis class U protein-like n=1 Tax=Acropora digitifera TaxID=70779 RepID=UPI00077A4FC1|nr:PREDICTED: phosphatidylinositol glycan anchor biosynthesis class U protein-like [Acropora digitifera]
MVTVPKSLGTSSKSKMADQGRLNAAFFLALITRLFLIYSPVKSWLINRIELSTPLTSWNRVQEGLSLVKNGVSPYTGDVVHETPLVLAVFLGLQQVSESLFPLFFVACDLLIGCFLYKLAVLHCRMLQNEQENQLKFYAKSAKSILINQEGLNNIPLLVSSIYLLNPYSIGSCVAQSTVVFTNFAVSMTLLSAMKGSILLGMLGVSFGAYHSLYPITLLPPVILILFKVRCIECELNRKAVVFILCNIGSFFMWILFLFVLSYQVFHSWDFLTATHGFILQVSDLTPNMGLFWYFFTEMFEHFRMFFLWVFQLNAFFYCIPMTIKLRYVLVSLEFVSLCPSTFSSERQRFGFHLVLCDLLLLACEQALRWGLARDTLARGLGRPKPLPARFAIRTRSTACARESRARPQRRACSQLST